jgi:hypothetical protein
VRKTTKEITSNDDAYLELFIRMEDMEVIYTRYEFTFVMWFALLGGVTKGFNSYFRKMTTAVSKKLFEDAILTDLFFVKKRVNRDTEHQGFAEEKLSLDKSAVSVLNKMYAGGEDETRPVTHREEQHFKKLKVSLETHTVKSEDLHNIVNHVMLNRKKY